MAFTWNNMAIISGATAVAALQINQLIANTRAELTRRRVDTTLLPEVVVSGSAKTKAIDLSKIKESINKFAQTKITYNSLEGEVIDKMLVDNIRTLLDNLNSNVTGRGINDCASSCTGLCSNACAGGCANTCAGSCAGSCSNACTSKLSGLIISPPSGGSGESNCCASCGGGEGGN